LKVFSTILLLPLLYLVIAIVVGINFGFWWSILVMIALLFSSIASVRLIEAEVGLLVSMLSVLRLTRLGSEIDDLRATRAILVSKIRALTDRLADPELPRLFTDKDFGQPAKK
jgi:hypothetical protein